MVLVGLWNVLIMVMVYGFANIIVTIVGVTGILESFGFVLESNRFWFIFENIWVIKNRYTGETWVRSLTFNWTTHSQFIPNATPGILGL